MELSHVETAQESSDRLASEITELRASRRRLVLAADAERRSIERDLHDGLQQHLVALAVDVQLARQALAEDPDRADARLRELGETVQLALEEAGTLAHRIHPPLTEMGGLTAALRAAATTAGVRTRIDVDQAAGHPPEIANAVYACWLAVLGRATHGVDASIVVDGMEAAVAFEMVAGVESPRAASAAVLDLLRDRVDALGGRLTASTEPGRLRLTGSVPLSG